MDDLLGERHNVVIYFLDRLASVVELAPLQILTNVFFCFEILDHLVSVKVAFSSLLIVQIGSSLILLQLEEVKAPRVLHV